MSTSTPTTSLRPDELAAYRRDGHLGPFPLLDDVEVAAVLSDHRDTFRRIPWYKSLHLYDSACTRAALRPEIVDRVAGILGPDVILWGTQVMTKPPSRNHRWHVDVETLEWSTVNVWVALRNVTLRSTIQLVPGSHTWGVSPQDLERSEGLDLDDGAAVAAAARRIDPGARVVSVDLAAGQFVLFDGLLWHGSENATTATRSALLTQYSPADVEARIPATFAPPIEWKAERPACVLAAGQAPEGRNRLVQPVPVPHRSLRERVADRLRSR